MLMTKERPRAIRTLRGWAIGVLQEAGAIRFNILRGLQPRDNTPASLRDQIGGLGLPGARARDAADARLTRGFVDAPSCEEIDWKLDQT